MGLFEVITGAVTTAGKSPAAKEAAKTPWASSKGTIDISEDGNSLLAAAQYTPLTAAATSRALGLSAASEATQAAYDRIEALQSAGALQKLGLRQQVARAISGSLGGAGGGPTGGAMAAQGRQAAIGAQGAVAQFEAQMAKDVNEARHKAAMMKLDEAVFQSEAGDFVSDRGATMQYYQGEISAMNAEDRSQKEIDAQIDTWIAVEEAALLAGTGDKLILEFLKGIKGTDESSSS